MPPADYESPFASPVSARVPEPLIVPVASEWAAVPQGRYLPKIVLFTTLVAGLPIVVAWALTAAGAIGPLESAGVAMTLSLLAASAGSAYWRRHGSREQAFGDLLLWGWLTHRYKERRLVRAIRLLGLSGTAERHELSIDDRARLIERVAATIEAQDRYLHGHSRRVARHAAMIARELELPPDDVTKIRVAAAVHDVGKLAVPRQLLDKPGPLTDREFAVVRRHAEHGAAIVAALGDPELTSIVRHHHERLDGAGYPAGLVGDQTPLGARIIAVADTFDALTSARPYRPAARHEEALRILIQSSGSQLDPAAVHAFLRQYAHNRAVILWTLLLAMPKRALAWLTGEATVGGIAFSGKLMTGVLATVAAGAAAAAVAPSPPIGAAKIVREPLPIVVPAAVRTSSGRVARQPRRRLADPQPSLNRHTRERAIRARRHSSRHSSAPTARGTSPGAAPTRPAPSAAPATNTATSTGPVASTTTPSSDTSGVTACTARRPGRGRGKGCPRGHSGTAPPRGDGNSAPPHPDGGSGRGIGHTGAPPSGSPAGGNGSPSGSHGHGRR